MLHVGGWPSSFASIFNNIQQGSGEGMVTAVPLSRLLEALKVGD
jgi:hypothetical protein